MKKIFFTSFLLAALFFYTYGDEGMWLPSLVQKLNIKDMQELGFELNADDIYDINHSSLKDAIGSLDRGSCTASLISPNGLLLTNYHCGYSEIQSYSSVEHNYLEDGFWAQTMEEELPNPGKTISFLISMEDVTDLVLKNVTDEVNYQQRLREINRVSRFLTDSITEGTHYDAEVNSLYNDNQYYLFVYEVFEDVRLVGCPPSSIGKFGGETDNWTWPRHNCDFCLFRVYTGTDGRPAPYSENNIPLEYKNYLSISLDGVELDDFSMILGFPGGTDRYMTSYGVEYTMNVTNKVREEVRSEKLAIIEDYMDTSLAARIQYASKYSRSSNYYKFSIGQNEELGNLDIIESRRFVEDEFTQWVNSGGQTRIDKYGSALDMIREAYAELSDEKALDYLRESLIDGTEIFKFAYNLRDFERLLERSSENQYAVEWVVVRMKDIMDDFFKDYDAETDLKIAAALMKLYHDNNPIWFYPLFFDEVDSKYKGDFNKYVEKMFSQSVFDNKEELSAFLENPELKILEKDMIFQAAIEIYNKYYQISDMVRKTEPLLNEGNRLFLKGLMEMHNDMVFYPDANSTLRLTYGKLRDYEPRDGVTYKYFTTLKGYIQKEIPGDLEFHVPERLKELYYENDFGRYTDEDGTLHTCFITDNDITGGNSGSPVINGKGELIGVAFDGNWEAMSGDIAYEPELQRSINVDIRFILWVIDKFAGAGHLIDEMTIIQ